MFLGALSILDLIDTAYKKYITKNKLNKFVLSKGHASLALYVVLEKYKIIKNVNTFCSYLVNMVDIQTKIKLKVLKVLLDH